MANKNRYDYESEEFANAMENFAKKGLTDREIAMEVGLNATHFIELKSKYDTISEALARGRAKITSAVRQKYLAVALGGLKRKTTTRKVPSRFDDEADIHEDGMIVLETTEELPPNLQGLGNWLFNHDEEWRKKVIDGKKLDVTTNGKDMPGVQLVFADTPLSESDMEEIRAIQEGREVDATEENSINTGISEA